jgi:hypothetical protein
MKTKTLPSEPWFDEEGEPMPYLGEGGSIIMPMSGKHAMMCLNALLMASDPPPKKRAARRRR